MIVMTALLIPAMVVRFYQGWFQMLLIDFPLFTASSASIAIFYLASQRELYPKTWMKTFRLRASMGSSSNNWGARS